MKRAVAYYRVSTRQQQRSGLGIEAQKAAIARFAEAEGLTITAEYSRRKRERAPTLSTAGRSLPPPWPPLEPPNAP